jgi:hypothetical protein
MTLVLAALAGDAVVLVADRRVLVRAPGEQWHTTDDKLHHVAGFGIATFGEGPPNDPVPQAFAELALEPRAAQNVDALAHAIRHRFARHGPAVAGMRILAGGFADNGPGVWTIDAQTGRASRLVPELGRPPFWSCGRTVPFNDVPPLCDGDAEGVSQFFLSVQRDESARSDDVGPPYDVWVIRRGNGIERRRIVE